MLSSEQKDVSFNSFMHFLNDLFCSLRIFGLANVSYILQQSYQSTNCPILTAFSPFISSTVLHERMHELNNHSITITVVCLRHTMPTNMLKQPIPLTRNSSQKGPMQPSDCKRPFTLSTDASIALHACSILSLKPANALSPLTLSLILVRKGPD